MTTKAVENGVNGVGENLHVQNGVAVNGVGCNGGICYKGASNGIALNGTADKVALNGTSNGVTTNGVATNGVDHDDDDIPYRLNKVYGVLVPTYITKERIDELRKMPVYSDDLFIVTYPKSGTTWMQQIVKLIRNNGVDDSRPVTEVIPWVEQNPQRVEVSPLLATFLVDNYLKCHSFLASV